MKTGTLIREARESKGFNQEDLADEVGVSKNYISLVENNKKDPSIKFLQDVSVYLGIPAILLTIAKVGMPEGKTPEEIKIRMQVEKLLERMQLFYIEKNKPVIKQRRFLNINTLDELSKQLGLPLEFMEKIADNIERHYFQFSSKDKKGKERTFYQRNQELKIIQKRINQLLDKIKFPKSIQGGIKGRSILSNAIIHVNKGFVANYDVKNFFPSISHDVVYKTFIRQKCSPEVARMLTRLTTADYMLPQGFATSPKITGLVVMSIDKKLQKLLEKSGFSHTFWIDDLTISGSKEITKNLETKIEDIFTGEGFILHNGNEKRQKSSSRQKQKCTGIVVNKKLNVDKSFRERIKNELHICAKYGVGKFLEEQSIDIPKGRYLGNLFGRINFLCSVNPRYETYKETYKEIREKEGI